MRDEILDQPPGISSDEPVLPDAADAAERVAEFLRWYGDGRITVLHKPQVVKLDGPWTGPALFARDLEALVREVSR